MKELQQENRELQRALYSSPKPPPKHYNNTTIIKFKFNNVNNSSLLSLTRKPTQQFPVTLDEALQNLVATLEDYRGQWRELRELEAQVARVEEVLRGEV